MVELEIRKFRSEDRREVLLMMKEFYNSSAVYTNGSDEIFSSDFDACISNSPYVEGYILYDEYNIMGYAMLAKSFSTEFGKMCIHLEDLYLKEAYRGMGIIPRFIRHIQFLYPSCLLKLEVEQENVHAVHVYKKCGFKLLPYVNMISNL